MPITHQTPADGSFSPRGKGAWEEEHTLPDSSEVTFLQSGSGATPETVESALRDLRAGISTDTIYSRFYRADATFNDTVDHGTFLGYNLTGFGQIENAAEPSILVAFEPEFNDGSKIVSEWHVNMAGPNQSYVRPILCVYDLTGAAANTLSQITLTSEGDIDLLAGDGDIKIEGSTLTMSGTAEHTGTFLVSSRLFLTTNATDSSSLFEIGGGDQAAGTRTNIRWRNGGFTAPSDANALANGDKGVFWNSTTLKLAFGADNGVFWFQNNGSGAASYKWYGGTSATPAEQMSLSTSGLLSTVGGLTTTLTNGQATTATHATASVSTPSGTTATATNLIPANSLVFGVTIRVTTLITGATSISIGDGSDADRWGTGIAVAANTTTNVANFTIASPVYYAAATSVVLTAAGGDFTAGAVRITVHYMSLTAATS